MRDKNVVVLDIQSSKISVLVGYESVNQNYKIVCKNIVDYAGFMQGKFLLEEKLEEEISNVLNLTQINYNRKIEKVYVGVPAEFCYNGLNEAELQLKMPVKIKQKHLDVLFEKSSPLSISSKTLINRSAVEYQLDDEEVDNPIGKTGCKIWCRMSEIFASNYFVELIGNILDNCKIKEYEFVSAELSEGLYLFDEDIRKDGAVVIDCGYITTSLFSVKNEGLLDLKSFSKGGGYITSDLAEILELGYNDAEMLKRKLVLTIQPTELDVYQLSKDKTVDVKTANDIALARIDAIIDGIKKCLSKFRMESDRVYLTGGGIAKIKGIKYYLGNRLSKKVEIEFAKQCNLDGFEDTSSIAILKMAVSLEKKYQNS